MSPEEKIVFAFFVMKLYSKQLREHRKIVALFPEEKTETERVYFEYFSGWILFFEREIYQLLAYLNSASGKLCVLYKRSTSMVNVQSMSHVHLTASLKKCNEQLKKFENELKKLDEEDGQRGSSVHDSGCVDQHADRRDAIRASIRFFQNRRTRLEMSQKDFEAKAKAKEEEDVQKSQGDDAKITGTPSS